jgi:hypothetical protein
MLLLPITMLLALATAPVVTPDPASAPQETTAAVSGPEDVPIPKKIPSPDAAETAPSVNIRTIENGDVVEEYRQGGRIFMVRITPKHGKPYYLYDDDRNGRLDRTDADRANVSPVYWTIYEWD